MKKARVCGGAEAFDHVPGGWAKRPSGGRGGEAELLESSAQLKQGQTLMMLQCLFCLAYPSLPFLRGDSYVIFRISVQIGDLMLFSFLVN